MLLKTLYQEAQTHTASLIHLPRGVKAGITTIKSLNILEKMHTSVSYFTITNHALAKGLILLSDLISCRSN